MTKITVTDEMVERAHAAFWENTGSNRDGMRRALEAALTEPEEIPVTEEMLGAGYTAYNARPGSPNAWDCLRDAYRAMDKIRRKSEKPPCDHDWVMGTWTHPNPFNVSIFSGEKMRRCWKCGAGMACS